MPVPRIPRRGSHRPTQVTCDFASSPKCKKTWTIEERLAAETRRNNDGRIVCIYCSRQAKNTGRANPNTRYKTVHDGLFDQVDREEVAYLLGWIASDGAVKPTTISIFVHEKDAPTLRVLRDIVAAELPVRRKAPNLLGFDINSKRIATRVCSLLHIEPRKKSDVVGFPQLANDDLRWAFVRGFFDGDGSIVKPPGSKESRAPRCNIATGSLRMREAIKDFCGIPCYHGSDRLEWNGTAAMDFLAKLYDGAKVWLGRKRDLYIDWCTWVPSLTGPNHGVEDLFRWVRTLPGARPPSKTHASDSGYDLSLIERGDTRGIVQFFRTGIKVQPAHGWYFDLVARSSITKTGYFLANGIGVIDRSYSGEIMVPLIKIDPSAPELELPARVVQIIPRPVIHVRMQEVDSLEPSARGTGGFGSTGT